MNSLIRLYPPEWRRRYGSELAELAADSPGWRTRVDLVRGALDAWTRSPGGDQVAQRLTRLAAVLMVLPLLFLGINLANEVTGSESHILDALFRSPLGEWLVVLSPFVALALVLLPGVRINFDRQQSEPAITIAIHLGRFQILILAAAALTALAFLVYAFFENYVPRAG